MNKVKSAGTTVHLLPVDEKHRKQWLAKCKLNNNFNNVSDYSGRLKDCDSVCDSRNELLVPSRKKIKSDEFQNKWMPPGKTSECVQLVAVEVKRTVQQQDTEEKNLVGRSVRLQGNRACNSRGKAANSVQVARSPEHSPHTGASGCPMAMKGKMRYELVTTDWKPVKTEPSVVTPPTSDTNAHTNGTFVSLGSPKSPKPAQPIKKCRLSTEESEKSGDAENDDDIRALEEEIIELQEYNAKVESEMIKLRTDITQMEQHIRMTERDNQSLTQKSHRMSEYYESLRNNFISLLDQVRLPNFDERPTHDNFDTYLNKLQSLCVESCKEENKAILSSVKQALQDFPIHLTTGWLRS